MRILTGLMCVIMMVTVVGGCDKEEQQSAAPAAVDQTVAAAAVEQADPTAAAEPAAPAEPAVEQTAPAQPAAEQTPPAAPAAEQAPAAAPQAAPIAPAVIADPEAVVVAVNGDPIKEAAVAAELNKRMEAMKKRMPAGQEIREPRKQQIRMSVVDMLVQQKILSQELAKRNVSVSDEKIMEEFTKIIAQQGKTLEDVKTEIAQYGMTMDDVKSQIRPQVEMQALSDACEKDPAMQAEAKKFYDENPSYFQISEQVRASHILIKAEQNAAEEAKAAAKQKAQDILARAKAGEDFAALAKEFSEDPGSKDKGGEYTFPRGQMVKPFEDTAFGMEPGQISDLVETQFGYHIIKLSEKTPAGVQPLEKAQKQIITYLLQKQMKENAKIEYSKEEQAIRDQLKRQEEMMQQQMREQQMKAQQEAKLKAEQEAKETAEKAAVEAKEPAAEPAPTQPAPAEPTPEK